jgi:hypothetical protein
MPRGYLNSRVAPQASRTFAFAFTCQGQHIEALSNAGVLTAPYGKAYVNGCA